MEEVKVCKRKVNWLPQETHLMLQQLQEHKSVLRDKCCPQRLKRAAWASITKIINDAHGNGRKQEEVEKRWQNVKFKAMKERSEYKKSLPQTGGGPLPMNPDDTNKLIWDILGRDSESVGGIEVDEVEDKSVMYLKINGVASASQPTNEVDEPHFIDADECMEDSLSLPTTTHCSLLAVDPPPSPPSPPQIPGTINQVYGEAIASHYGRSVDCYKKGIDAYVSHLAFLERYLDKKCCNASCVLGLN
ncbi:uncharacterized protein LOC123510807 isoform X2 [Portunus trituberculatus]|uniref:uncharacterized protein LOC123510807 isoform X2 n=1 Tax=Portunus trituberculatus TaxID=210409 RepID=UPI001E1CB673|nr:uncharacterized protein LOC123510807 isoform X2 [Portunus trituberculatus]